MRRNDVHWRTESTQQKETAEETADYADWSRLGAGYRRQDCQCVLPQSAQGTTKIHKEHVAGKPPMFRRFARKTFGSPQIGAD